MNEKEMLSRAIALAAIKHEKQERKDGTPYIYHPLMVAKMVKDYGYDIKHQTVAILHDLLEDTDVTEDEIRQFGDDIYHSVKLLTKQDGVDEALYIEAILTDSMAAVVKNADKINNMWDAAYCDDKTWAKKYVKNAQIYYNGKFSYALNSAIEFTRGALSIVNPQKRAQVFTKDEMLLYYERKAVQYEIDKELYLKNTSRPDLENKDIQYWYNDSTHSYFCFNDKEVWYLGKAGWLPMSSNPIHRSEYGEDLSPTNLDEILKYIEKKKSEGYFYDFVDLSLL